MDITDKVILAFGGAGFIGSRVCEYYTTPSLNNTVYTFDNLDRNALKHFDFSNRDNFELIVGDITDSRHVEDVVDEIDPDIIYNFAAVAGVENVLKHPLKTLEVNMMGTYNILNALRYNLGNRPSSGLYRFIYFSTSEVFGQYAFKPSENQPTALLPAGEGRWIYSVSKLASESVIDAFAREVGLSYVIVRPFNIYGVGQVGEGAIHTFINRALQGLPLEIRGDGDQIRSWCYIDDMVDGIKLCTSNPYAIGHTFNIGNPRGTITINMLAYLIKELCQSNSDIVYVPMDYEDVELRIPSIEKAKRLIGYIPKVDIIEGLKKTIDWYRRFP